MSLATTLLAAGFNALLATNGEPLVFRDAELTGVVNRDPFAKVVRTPDFNPRDNSTIRIRTSDVSSVPRAGEEFVDRAGMAHRVEKIKRLGDWLDCECKTSDPLFALLTTEEGIQLATASGALLQAA
jgi:hypothetical protein